MMPEWLGGGFLNSRTDDPEDRWQFAASMLERWYNRVLRIREKAKREELDSTDWDFLFAYFIWCYHLGDWLRASKSELVQPVNEFIAQTVELQIVRDLCNGLKHARIDRNPRDAGFNMYREMDHTLSALGENPVRYRIASGDGQNVTKYDLFELATNCVNHWRAFLLGQQLIIED